MLLCFLFRLFLILSVLDICLPTLIRIWKRTTFYLVNTEAHSIAVWGWRRFLYRQCSFLCLVLDFPIDVSLISTRAQKRHARLGPGHRKFWPGAVAASRWQDAPLGQLLFSFLGNECEAETRSWSTAAGKQIPALKPVVFQLPVCVFPKVTWKLIQPLQNFKVTSKMCPK